MTTTITCSIEHHAILFACFARHAILLEKAAGRTAILTGLIKYGKERGARMALNALARGDELNTLTSQVYGEWKPDYDGQMLFGRLRTQPTLQTYISKCAWCDAWKKHDMLEYGKLYCIDIDDAVYKGFRPDFTCTPLTDAMSWGGERCEFDWGHPLSDEEVRILDAKKTALGISCVKDFNFHTAHLFYTISVTLKEHLPHSAALIIQKTLEEYTNLFGQEYFDVLDGLYPPS